MGQLELLSHFYGVTWNTLGGFNLSAEATADLVFKYALSAPYLMHEILAIAALHLALLRPDHREHFRDCSAGFQARAIALFNGANTEIDASTCVPMFLFSALLGIHVLCDTLHYYRADLNTFLDQFITYINLHRGVRVITRHAWDLLKQSELQPLIDASGIPPGNEQDRRLECDRLEELIERSDLSASSKAVYQDTIEHLRWVITAVNPVGLTEGKPHLIFAWSTLISTEYIDLLQQRRPEALVILAHYAVLLHQHRRYWCFTDGGRFLISSIKGHLGPYWAGSLAWPVEVLNATDPD